MNEAILQRFAPDSFKALKIIVVSDSVPAVIHSSLRMRKAPSIARS
jgi:hypothetical protein